MISNIRSTKAELNITPKLYCDIIFSDKSKKVKSLINQNINLIKQVGRVNSLLDQKNFDKNTIEILVFKEKTWIYKLSKKHSVICADYLIKAELVDAKSHGLARLKMYCDRLKKELINPKPKIKIKKISSSVSYVNADNSIGFVSADIGINQAIKNAKKTGIGLVAVKKSSHYGLSVFYA